MKKILKILFIASIINPIFLSSLYSENNWNLVIDKNNIQVYTKPVENSSIDEIITKTVINARIEVIGEVLKDVPSHPQWMPDYKSARIIKNLGNDNMIVYVSVKTPWPLMDRDLIVKINTIKDYKKKKIIVNMTAVKEPLVPVKKDHIRMKELTGKWFLEYIDRENTKLVYTFRANPAGSIPAALANYFARYNPYETLLGLKKMVKKEKYIEAGKKSKDREILENILKSESLDK